MLWTRCSPWGPGTEGAPGDLSLGSGSDRLLWGDTPHPSSSEVLISMGSGQQCPDSPGTWTLPPLPTAAQAQPLCVHTCVHTCLHAIYHHLHFRACIHVYAFSRMRSHRLHWHMPGGSTRYGGPCLGGSPRDLGTGHTDWPTLTAPSKQDPVLPAPAVK